eukprot:Phypoly_transcript_00827.p1 GENE.Phypoly_transcript_00827~~Phypoly_transcript_00827.p1  ORF type:complete len:746 (+),score=248.72 Phypoly_transcript_00827:1723-3960(+)
MHTSPRTPRTHASAASPKARTLGDVEAEKDQEEERDGEYCPPVMFYSSCSPQRKAPAAHEGWDSPSPVYYSPNIYIEPPNVGSEQLGDKVSPRRRTRKPPRDVDTHAVLETVAAEFLRYLRLRRGHIPPLQLAPTPSPPSSPPSSPPPLSHSHPRPHPHPLPHTHPHTPKRVPSPEPPSHYSGKAHEKCKIPPKHELFKASPPPSKRPPARKIKETGISTQTSFKDLPSQQPFSTYLPPPRGYDTHDEIHQQTSPTFHSLTQPPAPPKPQPAALPQPILQLTSLQTDVSTHPDVSTQVRASIQSLAGLLATSSHEPQELDDQMRQLEALQLQLRELQLRALQKPDAQNRQQSPRAPQSPHAHSGIQPGQIRQSLLSPRKLPDQISKPPISPRKLRPDQIEQSPRAQPQISQSPQPPKYPAKYQASLQPKLVPATNSQTTSALKIEEPEYKSRWKKMREAGSFLAAESESETEEERERREEERRRREVERREYERRIEVGETEEEEDLEEMYSDFFESSDELDESRETRKKDEWKSESESERKEKRSKEEWKNKNKVSRWGGEEDSERGGGKKEMEEYDNDFEDEGTHSGSFEGRGKREKGEGKREKEGQGKPKGKDRKEVGEVRSSFEEESCELGEERGTRGKGEGKGEEGGRKNKKGEGKDWKEIGKKKEKDRKEEEYSSNFEEEGMKSGSFASSGEIDEIIQKVKGKQKKDEIEEDISVEEELEGIDEELHHSYDDDFVSDDE